MKKRKSPLMHRWLVGFVSLLAVFGASWLADGIKGECLFETWSWFGECSDDSLDRLCRNLIPLLLTILSLTWLYHLTKDFIPLRHLQFNKSVRSHKVLIAALSPMNPVPLERDTDGKKKLVIQRTDRDGNVQAELPLTGVLVDDIKAISENINEPEKHYFWKGQQFLRALLPHVHQGYNHLEKLVLLGSPGSNGSYKDLNMIKALAGLYLPANAIHIHYEEIDFENVEQMQTTLDKLIKHYLVQDFHEEDIIIDTTGGFKTASIAAALTTLHWSKIEFQYVPTGGKNPQPMSFNVVIDTPPRELG